MARVIRPIHGVEVSMKGLGKVWVVFDRLGVVQNDEHASDAQGMFGNLHPKARTWL